LSTGFFCRSWAKFQRPSQTENLAAQHHDPTASKFSDSLPCPSGTPGFGWCECVIEQFVSRNDTRVSMFGKWLLNVWYYAVVKWFNFYFLKIELWGTLIFFRCRHTLGPSLRHWAGFPNFWSLPFANGSDQKSEHLLQLMYNPYTLSHDQQLFSPQSTVWRTVSTSRHTITLVSQPH